MLDHEPVKYCRRRVDGFSEISEHGSTADMMNEEFLKLTGKNKACRLPFKWVILLLGAVVIIGGMGTILFSLAGISSTKISSAFQIIEGGDTANASILSNYTDFSRDASTFIEDRKKRSITDETDIEDKNTNSRSYNFTNLFNRSAEFISAFGNFIREFKKTYFSNAKTNHPVTVYNHNINTRNTEISRTSSVHDRKKREIPNETEIAVANADSTLYYYFNNLCDQYKKFTSAFDAFLEEFKKSYNQTNHSGTIPSHRVRGRNTEMSHESQPKVDDNNQTITSDGLEVGTELKIFSVLDVQQNKSSQNTTTDLPIEHDTNSSTTIGTDVVTDGNSNLSDTKEALSTKVTMPNNDASPVSTTMSSDTERQNQSKSDLVNRDVTSSYSQSTVNRETSSNGENTVDNSQTENSTIDEAPVDTTTVENPQTNVSFADSKTSVEPILTSTETVNFTKNADVDRNSSIKETHIMKIPRKAVTEESQNTESTSVSETEVNPTKIYEVEENIENNENESDSDETENKVINQTNFDFERLLRETNDLMNSTEISEFYLKNLPNNSQPDDILLRIKNIFVDSRPTHKRSFRNVNQTDSRWKLYCYQKITNQDGNTDAKIIQVPVKPSDVKNLPRIRFRRDDSPPYYAHSLHEHQSFEVFKGNTTFGNDTSAIMDNFNPPEIFNLPAGSNVDNGLYYCTYTQHSRSANESDENLNSRIKSLLNDKSINWNDLAQDLCSSTEKMCLDGSQCIASEHWCNRIINCPDSSDEMNCSCKERVRAEKLCDGYFDCPDGEDEEGCFGCPENSFSCDDWDTFRPNATCVPISQRCDGRIDCLNLKDEKDCQLLADRIFSHDIFFVSYTSGYLHRNWKGKWYPVCEDADSKLSMEACRSELGMNNIGDVKIEAHPIPEDYVDQFVVMTKTSIGLTKVCPMNGAVYVKCPSEYCGTRVAYDNNKPRYRYKRDDKSKMILELLKNILPNGNKIRDPREIDERIVGGEASAAGFWPWIVALYKDGVFHCGAVILDKTWLMTAAHCVQGHEESYFEIQAGTLRRLSFSPTEQNRVVSHITVHSDYSRSDMKNDIALLRVERPLKMNRWIRPICLPEAGPPPGIRCTAVGWGATKEHGPDPDNMREVEVPIQATCKHEADREGDEICAGYVRGGHDTCQGDSGGPLLCKIPQYEDRWYVAGIVSHGEGCARPDEPGVYTRIALYLPWLKKHADDKFLFKAQSTSLQCPGIKCAKEERCIPKKKLCDNVIDCLNGDDEANCGKWTSTLRTADSGQSVNPKDATDQTKYKIDGNDKTEPMDIFDLDQYRQLNKNSDGKTNTSKIPDFNVFNSFLPQIFHNATLNEEFNNAHEFTCRTIKQILPKIWYCDGEVDCEDGTDEINCTCSDLLRFVNQSLICDDKIDCYDSTDEANCTAKICAETEFYCYKSHTCINKTQQCDGNIDCVQEEDEKNCFALSDTENVTFDYLGVPKFTRKGLVKVNEKGIWNTYCVPEVKQKQLHDICKHLGFRHTHSFEKFKEFSYNKNSPSCYAVELSCANYYDELVTLPWYANIYVNGNKTCMGLLLTDQWIVAHYNCHQYHESEQEYMVAVLGGYRKSENLIQSFYEQVIPVNFVHVNEGLEITILHLQEPVKESKYVNSLNTSGNLWTTPPEENTQCFLISGHQPIVLPMKSREGCTLRKCEFEAENKTHLCSDENFTNGFVICPSPYGWYLTATVGTEIDQYCSSNSTMLKLRLWDDPKVLNSNFVAFTSPSCTQGYRCKLGKCINWPEVCDGKTDCRNNEDESPERCLLKKTYNEYNISCKTYEFKCKNNKCVNRNFICDGNNDCGDNSDEPPYCSNFSCATYLNMTSPYKLCDARRDCADKSDENFSLCPSYCDTTSHFKCEKSGQCIPLEFVCDGESDCPNKEDEFKCWKLNESTKNINEPNLFIQMHGKWHKECITPEFINWKPEVVCSMAGHRNVTKYNKIPGTRTPTIEYRKMKLFNNIDFKLTGKPFVSNSTEDCNYVHLQCK